MCGICGIYELGESVSDKKADVRAMNRMLAHRGPDEQGYYHLPEISLGMRRLKIIDLVTGSQPIFNEDKNIAVVCNGEIYNYKILKKQLEVKGHSFYTRSDIEVIAHQYEEKGEDFVNDLNGDFSIALWDNRLKKLILARDRLGAKPLFYTINKDRLIFASEIKALFSIAGVNREMDFKSLDLYLALSYVPAPKSIFKEIKRISPAQMLVAQYGRYRLKNYWFVQKYSGLPKIKSERECIGVLNHLLGDAVKLRLNSDVPIGILLSSGMDSSAVAYYAVGMSSVPVKTYTVIFNESSYNEGPAAKITSNYLGTKHKEFKLEPDIVGFIENFAGYFDEPFGDYSCIPTYFISKMVKNDVTVALSGDGGDELLGGYPTYTAYYFHRLYRFLPGFIKKNVMPGLAGLLPVSFDRISLDFKIKQFVAGGMEEYPKAHFLWKGYFTDPEKNELYSSEMKSISKGFKGLDVYARYLPLFGATSQPMTELMNIDIMSQLAGGYTAKVDITSMANSLEVRSPFYDHRLVEFSRQIPDDLKINFFKTKYILRKMLADKLPSDIMKVPKRGFTVPMAMWLETSLKQICLDLLSESRINSVKLFNYKYISKLLSGHFSRKADNNRKIWALMSFMMWYKRFY